MAKTQRQQRIAYYVLVEIALHPVTRNNRVAVARQLGTQLCGRGLHKRHEAYLDRRRHGAGGAARRAAVQKPTACCYRCGGARVRVMQRIVADLLRVRVRVSKRVGVGIRVRV